MALEKGNEEDLFLDDFSSEGEEQTETIRVNANLTKTGRIKKVMDRDSDQYKKKVENITKANEARRQKALERREARAATADEIAKRAVEEKEKARILEETRQKILEQELQKQAAKQARKIVKQSLAVDVAKASPIAEVKKLERVAPKTPMQIEKAPMQVEMAPPRQRVIVDRPVAQVDSRPAPPPMTARQKLASFGF